MQVNGQTVALDKEGYLVDLSQWNEDVAIALAGNDGIVLSDTHWQVIHALRHFYETFDHAPNNRALVKYCTQTLTALPVDSAFLMRLFGGAPAKTAARISGLPRPTHCL